MEIKNENHLAKIVGERQIDIKGVFTAKVISGIGNFTGKQIYLASVSSQGRSQTGLFYTEYNEAEKEAREILEEMYVQLEADKIRWEEEFQRLNAMRNEQ